MFDRDRFGARLAFVCGVDIPVDENTIDIFGGVHVLK